jgi:hypothetical protein
MRYFLTRRHPAVSRILLVESGSRHLLEGLIPFFRQAYGEQIPIDLVTCYAGLPSGLEEGSTRAYRVMDYRTKSERQKLIRELRAARPSILAIICSDEPIMTKWKWALAFRLPAKLLILNENGDFFWLDRGHWRIASRFVRVRAGLTGGNAVPTILRFVLFPLAFAYLLLYAAVIHLRRKARV